MIEHNEAQKEPCREPKKNKIQKKTSTMRNTKQIEQKETSKEKSLKDQTQYRRSYSDNRTKDNA